MSDKKQQLRDLLKNFSKEELVEFLVESKEDSSEEEARTHEIDKNRRRRGRGGRKKNKGKKGRSGTSNKRGNSKGAACKSGTMDLDSPRENKFLDMMKTMRFSASEREELEQASESDKKDNLPARTSAPRNLNLVEVECRVCGDVYDVAPSMVYDTKRWKCNDCSTSAG